MKIPAIRIRFPYYYVPPCPACGSTETGRIVKEPDTHEKYTMISSLKNGEIIMFDPAPEPVNNLFCLSCGHQWTGEVDMQMLTREQIRQEQKKRGTPELLREYEAANGIDEKPKRSIISGWFPFLHP